MQAVYENGWPSSRSGAEAGKWHHSDIRKVAYSFTHKVFDEMVKDGGLR
jgi:hypothetical protein